MTSSSASSPPPTAPRSSTTSSRPATGTSPEHHLHLPGVGVPSEQPDTIAVDVDHDGPTIGQVAYSPSAVTACSPCSTSTRTSCPTRRGTCRRARGPRDGAGFSDVTLHRVAIVERSATAAKTPAVAVVGDLDDADLYRDNPHRRLLSEAADYAKDRRYRYWPRT